MCARCFDDHRPPWAASPAIPVGSPGEEANEPQRRNLYNAYVSDAEDEGRKVPGDGHPVDIPDIAGEAFGLTRAADPDAFPDVWRMGHAALPLDYVFEPGAPADRAARRPAPSGRLLHP